MRHCLQQITVTGTKASAITGLLNFILLPRGGVGPGGLPPWSATCWSSFSELLEFSFKQRACLFSFVSVTKEDFLSHALRTEVEALARPKFTESAMPIRRKGELLLRNHRYWRISLFRDQTLRMLNVPPLYPAALANSESLVVQILLAWE